MQEIKWDNSLSINIPLIDSQHQQLIVMINELSSAIDHRVSQKLMDQLFMKLVSYTHTHFTAEEKLMSIAGYDSLATHKSLHDRFTQKILGLYSDYKNGKKAVDKAVLDMLVGWLLTHIKTVDSRLKDQIKIEKSALVPQTQTGE